MRKLPSITLDALYRYAYDTKDTLRDERWMWNDVGDGFE